MVQPRRDLERAYRIALLPGDGIGTEVVGAARRVLEVLSTPFPRLHFEFVVAPIGFGALQTEGAPLPESTLDIARGADGVLHGASDAAAIPPGVPNPIGSLRRGLDAYANVRPARTYAGVAGPFSEVDLIVVRENTEGLYSGIEYAVGPDAACAVRVITRQGSARVARIAFELARGRRGLVTAVHKLGALRLTDGLWLDSIRAVAEEFPDVRLETRNVDATALEMVCHPQAFDVILAENQYGDILSDVAAGLIGSLGLAPAGNYGERWAYFEPVHGTAPDIAGQGIANPIATILAARMLLEHLGEQEAAERVEQAVAAVLAEGAIRTPDLGGDATMDALTEAIVARITRARS